MIKVSIILVHFGKDKILKDCINSIRASKPQVSYEIVVVDNNLENRGYSGGNNLGVRQAKGEYVLILNPDTLVHKGAIDSLVRFIETHKKVGVVAPTLLDPKDKVYPQQGTKELTPVQGIFALSFINKIFPNNPVSKKYLMKDINRNKPIEVDVVPGTAFLIKKELFQKIGGFDENFFLYFEEFDLGRRIKKAGYKAFIIPDAKLTHFWAATTPKSLGIKKVFAQSRFYYFKKNFGVLPALLVETFARMPKEFFIFLLIFSLGAFLRFYRLGPNIIFNGEMGRDYMDVWGILQGTHSVLIGPRTSHEWFFLPPIAYWIYAVILLIANFNPTAINLFFGLVGSAAILVCYHYVKKLFNIKTALISSFLLATSPVWIEITRASRYNMPAAIIFFPYVWFLMKSIKDKGKSLPIVGLILGLSMNFFPSPFLLIPATIVCFIFYRVRPKLKQILVSILAFIIPNVTFIIYDASHNFQITLQLFAWIPYRIFGFFGLYPKNTVDSATLSQNFSSIYRFITESFAGYQGLLPAIIFATVIICSLILLKKFYKSRNKEMAFFLIIINFLIAYIGLFVHGDPPEHYYYVIFPIPLILAGYILDKLIKNKVLLVGSTLILGAIGIFGLIKTNWYFIDKQPINYNLNLVSYSTQQKITDTILRDSKGIGFSIARIGLNDQFENNFANNYIYLLTIRGAKIDAGATTRYTIIEGANNFKDVGVTIFSENEVFVVRTHI